MHHKYKDYKTKDYLKIVFVKEWINIKKYNYIKGFCLQVDADEVPLIILNIIKKMPLEQSKG